MAEIPGTFRYPDGLTPGQSKDGGLSQLLYDGQGNLVDHATFFPDNEYEYEPTAISADYESVSRGALVADVLVVVGIAGAAIVAPGFKRWWQEKTYPRLKTLWVRSEDLAESAPDEGHSQAASCGMQVAADPRSPVKRLSDDQRDRLMGLLRAGDPLREGVVRVER